AGGGWGRGGGGDGAGKRGGERDRPQAPAVDHVFCGPGGARSSRPRLRHSRFLLSFGEMRVGGPPLHLATCCRGTDHRHRWLLRPRRERPRGSTAEQRDEVAPFQSPMPPVLPTG